MLLLTSETINMKNRPINYKKIIAISILLFPLYLVIDYLVFNPAQTGIPALSYTLVFSLPLLAIYGLVRLYRRAKTKEKRHRIIISELVISAVAFLAGLLMLQRANSTSDLLSLAYYVFAIVLGLITLTLLVSFIIQRYTTAK
jgi:hypothetical protein